jgi:hypothetical protein
VALIVLFFIGGERGIRTPGGVTLNGFQDRRNRPLCHLSGGKSTKKKFSAKEKYFSQSNFADAVVSIIKPGVYD